MTIVSLHPDRPVDGEIAETALSIAGQAALAIDNARLYGQQKAFADTMQRSLLPRAAPELPGLELGDVYESAARLEVGGDVYDYLTLGDGRLAVVLGDVTGHGVDATADMAMAKYVFRSLAREHPDPGDIPRRRERGRLLGDRAGPVHHDGRARARRGGRRGRVRERRSSGAAARAAGRHGRADRGARARARDRRAAGVRARSRSRSRPARSSSSTRTASSRRDGAASCSASSGSTRCSAERRGLPPQEIAQAVLAACRDWTGGELTDDFAVVVIKRRRVEATTA